MPRARGSDPIGRLSTPEGRAWLQDAAAAMRRWPSLPALRASSVWREQGAEIEALLGAIQTGAPAGCPRPAGAPAARAGAGSRPREGPASPAGRWRVVHWNLLKGIALEEIAAWLGEDPDLRDADVLLLSEVDVGMARSGNRHVAAELAGRLGLHFAFVPSYLELTRGVGADLQAPGENEMGLHGVAILTREPPAALRALPLPEGFDAFGFHEKRYGRRTALLARVAPRLWVASAHLEVRGTPGGRARQMAALLAGIEGALGEAGSAGEPPAAVLIGGDWNTHTFARGGLVRSARALARILATPAPRLARQLREPWRGRREPLFAQLARGGYRWEELNDRRPTAAERLGRVEESEQLAAWLRRGLLRIGGLGQRDLALRLDWFAGRGIEPAGPGGARAVGDLAAAAAGGACPSDHLPIVLDFTLAGSAR